MSVFTIKSWLNSIAREMSGIRGEAGPEKVAGFLRIPKLNNAVLQAMNRNQGDFSISVSFVGDVNDEPSTDVPVLIQDSRLRVIDSHHTVPLAEMRQVLSLVASLGLRTDDRTVRVTGQAGGGNVRLTTVHSPSGINVFMRCTKFGGYSISTLVERGTLSPDLAKMLVNLLMFYPSWTLVVCGPGGSGKSTMMNSLLSEVLKLQHSRRGGVVPSIGVMQGDASDFIVPEYGVPVVSPSNARDIISAARTCNTSVIVFGETTTEETAKIFIDSQAAAVCAATTTHGDIRTADDFLRKRGTLYIQMLPLQRKIVASAVMARLKRMLGDLEDEMVLLSRYDVLKNVFVVTEQGRNAMNIAKQLEEQGG